MYFHTWFNMHKKNMILSSFKINTLDFFYFYFHSRNTKIKRYPKKFIQLLDVIIDTFYPACLVRYSNGNCATISICKCNNWYCQYFGSNIDTFPVKYLHFFDCQYFFYRHFTAPLHSRLLPLTITIFHAYRNTYYTHFMIPHYIFLKSFHPGRLSRTHSTPYPISPFGHRPYPGSSLAPRLK